MMLGKMVYDTSRFGEKSRYTACRIEEGTDLIPALKKALLNLDCQIAEAGEMEDEKAAGSIPADESVKNFTYTFVVGKLYYRENSVSYR